ncbi:hypothetical protein M433DRAFT_158458 [Acidomyces richmondensis BFW]|nr:MAG: hypothetical protein FE78DRAFT_85790 [Acidomyces sp. 'richmondensis']KYG41962.1 hypothetical protein M433DRAFT_158458 [Acidomyces richmondensis BFW]
MLELRKRSPRSKRLIVTMTLGIVLLSVSSAPLQPSKKIVTIGDLKDDTDNLYEQTLLVSGYTATRN